MIINNVLVLNSKSKLNTREAPTDALDNNKDTQTENQTTKEEEEEYENKEEMGEYDDKDIETDNYPFAKVSSDDEPSRGSTKKDPNHEDKAVANEVFYEPVKKVMNVLENKTFDLAKNFIKGWISSVEDSNKGLKMPINHNNSTTNEHPNTSGGQKKPNQVDERTNKLDISKKNSDTEDVQLGVVRAHDHPRSSVACEEQEKEDDGTNAQPQQDTDQLNEASPWLLTKVRMFLLFLPCPPDGREIVFNQFVC